MSRQKEKLIKGKVVVITGASSGAGRAIAVEFATYGAQLVLAARREEALEEVAEECRLSGAVAKVVPTDVKDLYSLQDLANTAFEWGGAIHIWINNAGVLAAGEFDQLPAEVNEDVVRTNLLGYTHGAHAVLPYFKQQGFGTIINNISVGGWFPTPYAVAYSASKFGLRAFSEALKGELNDYPHIHICDLYPAFLDTPGIQHAANFTGKVIKPAPPVYDPRKIAKAITSLVIAPKSKSNTTAATTFLKLAYAVFPALTRNITASTIRNYLKQADDIENTTGNVLHPVKYGTSIYGGWQDSIARPSFKRKILVAAGIAAGLILLGKSK